MSNQKLLETIEKIGIKLEEKDFSNIKEIIRNASDSEDLAKKRLQAKSEAWMYQAEAGERVADFMIKKEQELQEV